MRLRLTAERCVIIFLVIVLVYLTELNVRRRKADKTEEPERLEEEDDDDDGGDQSPAEFGEEPEVAGATREPIREPAAVGDDVKLSINWTAVQQRANERKRRITEACERRGLARTGWTKVPANILISERFKSAYCAVGKVASTTWKKVFIKASGRSERRINDQQHHNFNAETLRVLHHMSSRRTPRNEERIRTYFKFFVVRHPFDRMVSAFNEKFHLSTTYQQTIGRRIVHRYRQNASAESLERGHDVALGEFVRYLLDQPRSHRDFHWTPQYDICTPCAIHYDYVAHYETLWEDATLILRRLGMDRFVGFPRWANASESTAGERRYRDSLTAAVPAEYVKKLRRFYERDFEFFGYT